MPTDSPQTQCRPGWPSRSRRAVGRHGCPVPASRTRPENQVAKGGGRPSAPQRSTAGGYNSARRSAHLPSSRASDRREDDRGALPAESAHGRVRRRSAPGSQGSRNAPLQTAGRAEFSGPTLRIHPFTSERFHVLLNSLFKVLFNFPSRYLSAIGLVPVFSLRWSLPPALGCIPKQPDS